MEEIDYTSYEAGYIDGDWYYLLMFYDMVSAGMAGVNAANNSLGSGGVLVTAEGVEIPGAVVVSGTEESIASVSGGIITGLLAALGAAGDQEGGSGKGDSEAKSIDDILDGAEETTNNAGIARNFEKTGGYEKTLEDFNALQPSNVKDIQTQYGPGKVGYLEDGTTVVARPGSKTGGATLEIKISNKKIYKIRY